MNQKQQNYISDKIYEDQNNQSQNNFQEYFDQLDQQKFHMKKNENFQNIEEKFKNENKSDNQNLKYFKIFELQSQILKNSQNQKQEFEENLKKNSQEKTNNLKQNIKQKENDINQEKNDQQQKSQQKANQKDQISFEDFINSFFTNEQNNDKKQENKDQNKKSEKQNPFLQFHKILKENLKQQNDKNQKKEDYSMNQMMKDIFQELDKVVNQVDKEKTSTNSNKSSNQKEEKNQFTKEEDKNQQNDLKKDQQRDSQNKQENPQKEEKEKYEDKKQEKQKKPIKSKGLYQSKKNLRNKKNNENKEQKKESLKPEQILEELLGNFYNININQVKYNENFNLKYQKLLQNLQKNILDGELINEISILFSLSSKFQFEKQRVQLSQEDSSHLKKYFEIQLEKNNKLVTLEDWLNFLKIIHDKKLLKAIHINFQINPKDFKQQKSFTTLKKNTQIFSNFEQMQSNIKNPEEIDDLDNFFNNLEFIAKKFHFSEQNKTIFQQLKKIKHSTFFSLYFFLRKNSINQIIKELIKNIEKKQNEKIYYSSRSFKNYIENKKTEKIQQIFYYQIEFLNYFQDLLQHILAQQQPYKNFLYFFYLVFFIFIMMKIFAPDQKEQNNLEEQVNLKLSQNQDINLIMKNFQQSEINSKNFKLSKNTEEIFQYLDEVGKKNHPFQINIRDINFYEISGYSIMISYIFTIGMFILLKFTIGGANKAINQSQKMVKNKEFKKNLGITFKDIAGMNEVKQEMQEFVDFLKAPEKFKKYGAKMPKGVLLSGPPGTGKTFLAKAIAGEAKVPFFYMSGSEFIEKYVGIGAARVRELFRDARKKSPSIIFIDEIDAIGKKRDSFFSHDEMQTTLNQLLVEMDGFEENQNIIVIGSTNMHEVLDSALLRPGRMDRIIEVNLPTLEERKMILKLYLTKIQLNPEKTVDYYSERLATLTPGFSGADLKNIINESAIISVRRGKQLVQDEDLEEAIEKVIGGIERKSDSIEEQKEIVAIHEAGHGVVSWFLEGGNPLVKITIKARSKGALGFAQYLPSESALYSKEEMLDQIASILGGRVAEMEFFGKSSTGASDDFQKAKKIAFEMVTSFGMSEEMKFVPFLLDEHGNVRFSEKTYAQIDRVVEKIIKEQTERCQKIVKEKKELIKKLADTLMEKKVLIYQDIIEILGERQWRKIDLQGKLV